jgi:hypothetical protein
MSSACGNHLPSKNVNKDDSVLGSDTEDQSGEAQERAMAFSAGLLGAMGHRLGPVKLPQTELRVCRLILRRGRARQSVKLNTARSSPVLRAPERVCLQQYHSS